jgi:hypothetical protein
MKFNKNNQKQSATLFSLLTFLAIAVSPVKAAIEPPSRKEASVPSLEQQVKTQETQETKKPIKPVVNSNDETWEKVELKKEWENILVDESGKEMLLAFGGRSF